MAKPPPGPTEPHSDGINSDSWRTDILGFLRALAERYGDVVGFELGRSPGILVNGAPLVRELFFEREACLRKPEFVKDSNRGHWGDGLTTLESRDWQERRQILQSSFGARSVSTRLPIVAQCTTDMLDACASDSDASLPRELRILTARIAARIILDAELEGYGPGEGRSGLLPFAEAFGEEYASTQRDPMATLVLTRPRAPRRMDTTVRIVEERIASNEGRGDILSDLVRARLPGGTRLTRDEILDEVIQMLYAGHLTIPYSLLNFWRDIAANEIAPKISAEADQLCAAGVPGLSTLSDSYCIAALKESMRLTPPAPILYREVDSTFELGGFEFARGVAVWVSPQLLHRDARYFPEPHRFLPERFIQRRLPGNAGSLYLPFGGGRRACVASQLALFQMTLISLLMAARFEPTRFAGGTSKEISYFLTPRNLKATITWV
jgi:cytochrome P450